MKTPLILLSVPLLLIYNTVSAYPSAPGTCNMNKMATLGHGPSKSTCENCYGVDISSTNSLVNIHLTGHFPYQGIVLLVKDKHTNKTLGEFQDFDQQLFTSVACDDDEDEQDKIEPDTIAVLGHIDAKLKNWPVNVGWNMIATKPLTELKLQGMIVIDYDNFHLLPETEFKIRRKIIEKVVTTTTTAATLPTTTTAITTPPKSIIEEEEKQPTRTIDIIKATHTIIQQEIEHEAGTFVQRQESNKLFLWVLTIFISLYFILSFTYRQLMKRKRVKWATSMLQVDEISLVTKTKDYQE